MVLNQTKAINEFRKNKRTMWEELKVEKKTPRGDWEIFVLHRKKRDMEKRHREEDEESEFYIKSGEWVRTVFIERERERRWWEA